MNKPTPPATDTALLNQKIDDAVHTAAKRRRLLTIAGVILCLVLAGYLGFAWWQISKVDAPTVVALVEEQARPLLERPPGQWAAEMKAQAPAVIDQAAIALQDVPHLMSERIESYVVQRVEAEMPQLKEQFLQELSALMSDLDNQIQTEMTGGSMDENEAEQQLKSIAQQFEQSLNAELDKIYERYIGISSEMIDYLDRLAIGDQLSEKQRLHRDILVNFLSLVQRVQTGKGQAG